MYKKIIRSLLFLGLLCLLLVSVGVVFLPKDNTEEAGMQKVSANAIRSQPKNSIDVLFLGDSEAHSGFIPLELWDQRGIPSFVCSSLDQKMYETWELLQMALEYQSPRVLVLETNVLYRVYPSTDSLVPSVEPYLPILRYHDRWKGLTLADVTRLPHYTAASLHRGYRLLLEAEPADTTDYMMPMEEWEPLSRQNRQYLQRIAGLCRERNIELLLFSVPSPANWTVRRHNTISDTAEELGVPYLDGNLLDLEIDWDTDTYDAGDHLNYYGASKVTEFLSRYLPDHYPLESRRDDPAYAGWDRDVEAFYGMLSEEG